MYICMYVYIYIYIYIYELQELGNECGKTKWVDVFKGKGAGTGMITYTTAEEVT